MHSDSTDDPHEERHWRSTKARSGRTRVLLYVNIFDNNISRAVYVVAVKIRGVVEILLRDFEISRRGIEALASAGNRRDADQFPALVERGGLLGEIDDNGWRTDDAAVVPVGLLEGQTFLSRRDR